MNVVALFTVKIAIRFYETEGITRAFPVGMVAGFEVVSAGLLFAGYVPARSYLRLKFRPVTESKGVNSMCLNGRCFR